MPAQLPLNLRLRDAAAFANYLPAGNAEAVQRLHRAVEAMATHAPTAEHLLYLWGPSGTGKTHLLQAACRLAQDLGMAPAYVPLGESAQLSVSLLEDIEQAGLVCLDDLERIAAQASWERALFGMYQRLSGTGALVVVAAAANPAHAGLRMPELATRLAAGVVYQLAPLTDAQKLDALQYRARQRGLELSREAARYVLARYPRDTHSLFDLLERIDSASLAKRRRVTIPFLRDIEGR